MAELKVALIVVAAGSSARFGTDKLSAQVGGRSVLERAVAAVRQPFPNAPLVLVVRSDQVEQARARWEGLGVRVTAGGARRQDSVRNGFAALDADDGTVVVIHDGARPFVPPGDVVRVVAAAAEGGAALLVAPVVDTVKRLRPDGTVETTVPRDKLARALTPQAFRADVLRSALEAGGDAFWTDEAALVERQGGAVVAVPGDTRNVKVTHPDDLAVVAGVFPRRTRVGQGVDVHPFAVGRPLWLCGILLPGETGLAGHSDSDAALHAVTDAILGACGCGDIGEHFPPSEERWRDAPSELFVRHAITLASHQGWCVAGCDLTLLAEAPRIAPHRSAMRARLAELLGLAPDEVNVKATTCEGMGFVGRKEGVVAFALVTLEPAAHS
ncbi:MAG: 2-C-methyl-D-erythritol 2,4-cyclodiphosphate synthase [Thermoanaerobaculaceae bacterium]|jgi:2-C-methyl-D-erythritol 4-phosphate cytidylyltransferase/2-C-methyl-D-erythritol 2,4-cyclodiphosphate synthase